MQWCTNNPGTPAAENRDTAKLCTSLSASVAPACFIVRSAYVGTTNRHHGLSSKSPKINHQLCNCRRLIVGRKILLEICDCEVLPSQGPASSTTTTPQAATARRSATDEDLARAVRTPD